MPRRRTAPVRTPILAGALLLLVACGSGHGKTAEQPVSTANRYASLAHAKPAKKALLVALGHPIVVPLAPGAEAQAEADVATSPKYAALRQALANAGATPDEVHRAVSGAFYYMTGHPEDVQYQAWAAFHDYSVRSARDFMAKVKHAEASRGITIDRAKLDAHTLMPTLAAQPLTSEQ